MVQEHSRKISTDCLVIGDLNVDIIMTGLDRFPEIDSEIVASDYKMVVGGSGGIFASVLAMLGINTSIISKIGDDDLGSFLSKELNNNNVCTSGVIRSNNEKTGITMSMSYKEGKSQVSSIEIIKKINPSEILGSIPAVIRHVHFPSYYMMENLKPYYVELIKGIEKKSAQTTFSMDTNDDPNDEWGKEIFDLLPYLDILFLNRKEALKISGQTTLEASISVLEKYLKKIIIKNGVEGYSAKIDGVYYKGQCINRENINFVDSTGAGDNFDAAFIYGYINNFSTEKTLELANLCAEKSIEYLGGVGTKQKYAELKNML